MKSRRFLFQQFTWCARSLAIGLSLLMLCSESLVYAAQSHTLSSKNTSLDFTLPAEFVSLEETYRGSSNKMIYFFQDAHTSLEAQENIANALLHLVNDRGVKTVFEEGYQGEVPTDEFFGHIQDPKVKEKIAYFYLDKLRLGAAEYAHIVREKPFKLVGVDHQDYYEQNLQTYRDHVKGQESIAQEIQEIEEELHNIANQIFPDSFRRWSRERQKYHQSELGLLEYLERSWKHLPKEDQTSYPLLSILNEARQSEDPQVLSKLQAIRAGELHREMAQLERALVQELLQTDDQKQLWDYQEILKLFAQLNQLEITPIEFEEVKQILLEFDAKALAQFMARLKNEPVFFFKRWQTSIQKAIQFYELAHARHETFEKQMDLFLRGEEKAAALVFGGFHAPSIKKILHDRQISYQVLSPHISERSQRHEDYYRQLMTEGKHHYEVSPEVQQALKAEALYQIDPTAVHSEIRKLAQLAEDPDMGVRLFDRMLNDSNRSEARRNLEIEDFMDSTISVIETKLSEPDIYLGDKGEVNEQIFQLLDRENILSLEVEHPEVLIIGPEVHQVQFFARRYPESQITLVDNRKDVLETMKTEFEKNELSDRLRLIFADARRLSKVFPQPTFDVIIGQGLEKEAFHNYEQALIVLPEVASEEVRILKPKGFIFHPMDSHELTSLSFDHFIQSGQLEVSINLPGIGLRRTNEPFRTRSEVRGNLEIEDFMDPNLEVIQTKLSHPDFYSGSNGQLLKMQFDLVNERGVLDLVADAPEILIIGPHPFQVHFYAEQYPKAKLTLVDNQRDVLEGIQNEFNQENEDLKNRLRLIYADARRLKQVFPEPVFDLVIGEVLEAQSFRDPGQALIVIPEIAVEEVRILKPGGVIYHPMDSEELAAYAYAPFIQSGHLEPKSMVMGAGLQRTEKPFPTRSELRMAKPLYKSLEELEQAIQEKVSQLSEGWTAKNLAISLGYSGRDALHTALSRFGVEDVRTFLVGYGATMRSKPVAPGKENFFEKLDRVIRESKTKYVEDVVKGMGYKSYSRLRVRLRSEGILDPAGYLIEKDVRMRQFSSLRSLQKAIARSVKRFKSEGKKPTPEMIGKDLRYARHKFYRALRSHGLNPELYLRDQGVRVDGFFANEEEFKLSFDEAVIRLGPEATIQSVAKRMRIASSYEALRERFNKLGHTPVKYLNQRKQWAKERKEFQKKISQVLRSKDYLNQPTPSRKLMYVSNQLGFEHPYEFFSKVVEYRTNLEKFGFSSTHLELMQRVLWFNQNFLASEIDKKTRVASVLTLFMLGRISKNIAYVFLYATEEHKPLFSANDSVHLNRPPGYSLEDFYQELLGRPLMDPLDHFSDTLDYLVEVGNQKIQIENTTDKKIERPMSQIRKRYMPRYLNSIRSSKNPHKQPLSRGFLIWLRQQEDFRKSKGPDVISNLLIYQPERLPLFPVQPQTGLSEKLILVSLYFQGEAHDVARAWIEGSGGSLAELNRAVDQEDNSQIFELVDREANGIIEHGLDERVHFLQKDWSYSLHWRYLVNQLSLQSKTEKEIIQIFISIISMDDDIASAISWIDQRTNKEKERFLIQITLKLLEIVYDQENMLAVQELRGPYKKFLTTILRHFKKDDSMQAIMNFWILKFSQFVEERSENQELQNFYDEVIRVFFDGLEVISDERYANRKGKKYRYIQESRKFDLSHLMEVYQEHKRRLEQQKEVIERIQGTSQQEILAWRAQVERFVLLTRYPNGDLKYAPWIRSDKNPLGIDLEEFVQAALVALGRMGYAQSYEDTDYAYMDRVIADVSRPEPQEDIQEMLHERMDAIKLKIIETRKAMESVRRRSKKRTHQSKIEKLKTEFSFAKTASKMYQDVELGQIEKVGRHHKERLMELKERFDQQHQWAGFVYQINQWEFPKLVDQHKRRTKIKTISIDQERGQNQDMTISSNIEDQREVDYLRTILEMNIEERRKAWNLMRSVLNDEERRALVLHLGLDTKYQGVKLTLSDIASLLYFENLREDIVTKQWVGILVKQAIQKLKKAVFDERMQEWTRHIELLGSSRNQKPGSLLVELKKGDTEVAIGEYIRIQVKGLEQNRSVLFNLEDSYTDTDRKSFLSESTYRHYLTIRVFSDDFATRFYQVQLTTDPEGAIQQDSVTLIDSGRSEVRNVRDMGDRDKFKVSEDKLKEAIYKLHEREFVGISGKRYQVSVGSGQNFNEIDIHVYEKEKGHLLLNPAMMIDIRIYISQQGGVSLQVASYTHPQHRRNGIVSYIFKGLREVLEKDFKSIMIYSTVEDFRTLLQLYELALEKHPEIQIQEEDDEAGSTIITDLNLDPETSQSALYLNDLVESALLKAYVQYGFRWSSDAIEENTRLGHLLSFFGDSHEVEVYRLSELDNDEIEVMITTHLISRSEVRTEEGLFSKIKNLYQPWNLSEEKQQNQLQFFNHQKRMFDHARDFSLFLVLVQSIISVFLGNFLGLSLGVVSILIGYGVGNGYFKRYVERSANKDDQIVTKGPYAYTQNPGFLAYFHGYVGFVLSNFGYVSSLLFVLQSFYWAAAIAYERNEWWQTLKYNGKAFEYLDYIHRVPSFLPHPFKQFLFDENRLEELKERLLFSKKQYAELTGGETPGSGSLVDLVLDETRILFDAGHMTQKNHLKPEPTIGIVSHGHLDHVRSFADLLTQHRKTPFYMTAETAFDAFLNWDGKKWIRQTVQKQKNRFREIQTGVWYAVDDQTKIYLTPASHILGASMIYVATPKGNYLYTGDFLSKGGQATRDFEFLEGIEIDYMFADSTYGAKRIEEPRIETARKMARYIEEIAEKGGRTLMPVFTIGKSVEILILLRQMQEEGTLSKDLPLYVAGQAVHVLNHFAEYTSKRNTPRAKEITRLLFGIDSPIRFPTKEEIQQIKEGKMKKPFVFLAGSGMLEMGLAKDLLPAFSNRKDAIILSGFQAPGTIGRQILDSWNSGSRTHEISYFDRNELNMIKIHNFRYYPIPSHSDQTEIVEVVEEIDPRYVVLQHGEDLPKRTLQSILQQRNKNLEVLIPEQGEHFELSLPEELIQKRQNYFNSIEAVPMPTEPFNQEKIKEKGSKSASPSQRLNRTIEGILFRFFEHFTNNGHASSFRDSEFGIVYHRDAVAKKIERWILETPALWNGKPRGRAIHRHLQIYYGTDGKEDWNKFWKHLRVRSEVRARQPAKNLFYELTMSALALGKVPLWPSKKLPEAVKSFEKKDLVYVDEHHDPLRKKVKKITEIYTEIAQGHPEFEKRANLLNQQIQFFVTNVPFLYFDTSLDRRPMPFQISIRDRSVVFSQAYLNALNLDNPYELSMVISELNFALSILLHDLEESRFLSGSSSGVSSYARMLRDRLRDAGEYLIRLHRPRIVGDSILKEDELLQLVFDWAKRVEKVKAPMALHRFNLIKNRWIAKDKDRVESKKKDFSKRYKVFRKNLIVIRENLEVWSEENGLGDLGRTEAIAKSIVEQLNLNDTGQFTSQQLVLSHIDLMVRDFYYLAIYYSKLGEDKKVEGIYDEILDLYRLAQKMDDQGVRPISTGQNKLFLLLKLNRIEEFIAAYDELRKADYAPKDKRRIQRGTQEQRLRIWIKNAFPELLQLYYMQLLDSSIALSFVDKLESIYTQVMNSESKRRDHFYSHRLQGRDSYEPKYPFIVPSSNSDSLFAFSWKSEKITEDNINVRVRLLSPHKTSKEYTEVGHLIFDMRKNEKNEWHAFIDDHGRNNVEDKSDENPFFLHKNMIDNYQNVATNMLYVALLIAEGSDVQSMQLRLTPKRRGHIHLYLTTEDKDQESKQEFFHIPDLSRHEILRQGLKPIRQREESLWVEELIGTFVRRVPIYSKIGDHIWNQSLEDYGSEIQYPVSNDPEAVFRYIERLSDYHDHLIGPNPIAVFVVAPWLEGKDEDEVAQQWDAAKYYFESEYPVRLFLIPPADGYDSSGALYNAKNRLAAPRVIQSSSEFKYLRKGEFNKLTELKDLTIEIGGVQYPLDEYPGKIWIDWSFQFVSSSGADSFNFFPVHWYETSFESGFHLDTRRTKAQFRFFRNYLNNNSIQPDEITAYHSLRDNRYHRTARNDFITWQFDVEDLFLNFRKSFFKSSSRSEVRKQAQFEVADLPVLVNAKDLSKNMSDQEVGSVLSVASDPKRKTPVIIYGFDKFDSDTESLAKFLSSKQIRKLKNLKVEQGNLENVFEQYPQLREQRIIHYSSEAFEINRSEIQTFDATGQQFYLLTNQGGLGSLGLGLQEFALLDEQLPDYLAMDPQGRYYFTSAVAHKLRDWAASFSQILVFARSA